MNTKDINTKKRKVMKDGELDLVGFKLPCFVLEDGTRVLSSRGMQDALKIVEEDSKLKRGPRLKYFLAQKSLQPFIYKGKERGYFAPIICYKGGIEIHGYEATVLADICDGMLEARNNIELSSRQRVISDQCEILIRAFAKTGIIALVDEATGYDKFRKEKLQTILKLYISEEILKWQKTFHDEFYEQIFRLWNWPSPENVKRPSYIGKLTNDLVYENLPEGSFVLPKLKEKTPKTKGDNYAKRFHQSLTDIGREALKKVIYTIEALASISKTKEEFLRLVKAKYPPQKELPSTNLDIKDDNRIAEESDPDKLLDACINTPPITLKQLQKELKEEREIKDSAKQTKQNSKDKKSRG